MGIFQRENGYYYLRVSTPSGEKCLSLETKDKAFAKDIYQAYLLDRIKTKVSQFTAPNGIHACAASSPSMARSSSLEFASSSAGLSLQSPQAKKPLITICFTQYLQSCQAKKLSANVMLAKKRLLKSLQKHRIKNPDELTQDALNRLLKDWGKLGKDSLDVHVKNIKAFLNFCIKKRYYDRADYETLSFPSKSTKVRDVVIPEKDYQRLLHGATDGDFALYLQTLWETGCRPNKIITLKKTDIDFAKGFARIFQNKTQKHKITYFTDELLALFQQAPQDELFLGAGKQKEFYSKKFKDLKEALHMPKEYCLYAFRHSFGIRILNKTKDIHLVSKLLGHSDISITAKHYINRNPEEIRAKLLEAHHG